VVDGETGEREVVVEVLRGRVKKTPEAEKEESGRGWAAGGAGAGCFISPALLLLLLQNA
jgi:hypothetical protein